MFWEKKSFNEMNQIINNALAANRSFKGDIVLGVPGTHLDQNVFPEDKIPQNAPYLKTFFNNPNHIGVHTNNQSEEFFRGTHEIEKDLIRICAEEVFKANAGEYDGYVATGGTEANIQGMWVARNYFMKEFGAQLSEIAILHSSDTHYSSYKSSNLLQIKNIDVPVDDKTRQIKLNELEKIIDQAKEQRIHYFIFIVNMGTTMFGSVDKILPLIDMFKDKSLETYFHIDAAFGGFIYPFTKDNILNFQLPEIKSITIDAHKMLQAPYGSGIFLTRKGYLQYTLTDNAKYVKGQDYTLCGSRSGANAVATWMILNSYGSQGGAEFCRELVQRTEYLSTKLSELGIEFFREEGMNIVTMKASQIPEGLVSKYGLVPDSHHKPEWVKIVVMEHVTIEKIDIFLQDLSNYLA
jgi:tyrosine decarboxylase/aspartate 1-decarboxylase